MIPELVADSRTRMGKSLDALHTALAGIRTGRASPGLIELLHVDAYGTTMPLNQLASLSAPEPRLLVVQPFDRHTIAAIEKAIQRSELGLNPANDGQIIRVPIPPLNEERRREFVRMVKARAEEARVAIRNIRREDMERLRRLEQDGQISADEASRGHTELQRVTDHFVEQVDETARRKEADLMEV